MQPDRRFRGHQHIRLRAEFQQVYDRGRKHHGRYMIVFTLPRAGQPTRLGIAATRKMGIAVERNRAKRRVRELFRHNPAPSGFDIVVVSAKGGTPTQVTATPGDERWPSWTPDGRLVFAHRGAVANGRQADPGLQWDLFVVAPVAGSDTWQAPRPLTQTTDNETHPRVSPDGRRVVFFSDRDSTDDVDVFAMAVPAASIALIRGTPGKFLSMIHNRSGVNTSGCSVSIRSSRRCSASALSPPAGPVTTDRLPRVNASEVCRCRICG